MVVNKNIYISYTIALILGLFLVIVPESDAQEVRLFNPSFEDTPRQGSIDAFGRRTKPPKGWFDCGGILFPKHTPPDIHKGGSYFWENDLGTAHGKTYLTLVVRDDDSYETISQKLTGKLKSGQCYRFSINLARSARYMSHTLSNRKVLQNFSQPAVVRIWGGNFACELKELLAESPAIDNTDWEEYLFKIRPKTDCSHITIEAFFKVPVFFGYNGNVCIDNASTFRPIPCDVPLAPEPEKEEIVEVIVVEDVPDPDMEPDPAPVVVNKDKSPEPAKPEPILDLKIDKIKVGSTINIKKLSFEPDQSEIKEDGFKVLDEIGQFLINHDHLIVEIGGHTNNKPPDAYCDSLSTERAKAVAEYLLDKGIATDRISYKGYGKRSPIATNKTPAGRKKNQRVQIRVLGFSHTRPKSDDITTDNEK